MKFDQAQHAKNIRLTSNFLAMSRDAAASALDKGDPYLLFFNLGGVVGHQLELALYHWRTGESPVPFLEGAVEAAQRGLDISREHPDWPHLERVSFTRVRFVTFLLGKEDRFADPVGPLDAPDKLLDYGLVERLYEKRPADQTFSVIEKVEEVKRLALLARTYRTYFAILEASPDALPDLVAQAEKNFAARARDGFYGGGSEAEGGGPGNAYVVDYRLGAVLRKVGYQGSSIHRYIW